MARPTKTTAETKPIFHAMVTVTAQLYVPLSGASTLAEAVEKAAVLSPDALWNGDVPINDVYETSLYVESVSGPSKELK